MAKYKGGQYVYIAESNRWIRKATVISYSGGFYTLGFLDGGLTRLREHRIYAIEQEAQDVIDRFNPPKPEPTQPVLKRTHHFYT